MKKKIIFLAISLSVATLVMAQAPPAPPGDPGSGNTPVGGGAASLAGGIAFMLGLAAGYGITKFVRQLESGKTERA